MYGIVVPAAARLKKITAQIFRVGNLVRIFTNLSWYDIITSDSLAKHENANSLDTILDLLRGAFPANIVQATFGKDYTEITKKNLTGHDKKVYEATIRKVKVLRLIKTKVK